MAQTRLATFEKSATANNYFYHYPLANLSYFAILLIALSLNQVKAENSTLVFDNSTGSQEEELHSDSNRGFHIGDTCQDGCSSVIENSYCNSTTNTCLCLETHPINIDGVTCVQPKNLYESCTYNQQCSERNEQAFCQELPSKQTQCSCRKGYHAEKAHEIPIRYECIVDSLGPLAETTVPAIVGLFISLTILLFLFCFVFKLFAQSRWARARAYADAGRPPPTITLEGDEQIDLEKQVLYRKASNSGANSGINTTIQVVRSSPSPNNSGIERHISSHSNISSRRGSGNNNSEKGSCSNPAQSRRGSNRPSLSSLESYSRRASLQRNGGAILTSGDLGSAYDEDCDVEQHITIIPNPRARRRGSMADHAFPELHGNRAGKKEPENLLILTRTTTDRHGRRHSVAVPLIPPPDGEKFEGGYHVERNPLTGGAKLVPPAGSKGVQRTRSISERRGRERPNKTKDKDSQLQAQHTQKDTLPIPGARNSRRHSYQSGVPGLAKDMDRLKVSPAGTGSGSSRGPSPRGSTKRRTSVRRSSRSGFLHFLDLAIAN